LARSALADENRKHRRYLAFLDRFTRQIRTELDTATPNEIDERLQLVLERSVALLPDDERQLVEWKYYQRRSVPQIAQILQAPEKAVESRLVRVRGKVKSAVLAELKHEPLA